MNDAISQDMANLLETEIEQAWSIRRIRRKESKDLAIVLLDRCRAMGYDRGALHAEVVVSVHLLYETDFEEAFALLMGIMDRMELAQDPIWYVRVMNNCGFGYVNAGKFDKAIDYLTEGIRVSREYRVEEMLAYLLSNLAEIQLDPSIAKYDEALALLTEAYEIATASEYTTLPLIRAYMAFCCERLGNWSQASQYADEAMALAENCMDDNTVDQCYHFLGEMYYNHSSFEDAVRVAYMSIEKQMGYTEIYCLTNNYYLLAKCYFELNNTEMARHFAELAMTNAEQQGMASIIGGVAELMSRMFEHEGDYAASYEQLKKVLTQNKKKFTQDLNNHISIIAAEQKNISLKKDAEIHRLKNVELKEKSDALEKLVIELRDTQQQLIQQEKMAALGNLIAGIAHEINTPFGVIQAAVQNINTYADRALSTDYPRLLLQLDEPMRHAFLSVLEAASRMHELISTSEERRIRMRLSRQMEELGITDPNRAAEWMLDIHLTDLTEALLLLFKSPERKDMMKVCYEVSGIMRNLANIQRAVTKASKTVFALKHYTHFDHQSELSTIDPTEEIKTILQLYEHQIKNRVEVVRDMSQTCAIACYPDELNQVWMNLIHNALQAMEYTGTLTLSSRCSQDALSITVADTGSGILPEHMDRIFDPFFTTKVQGVGSGLGLHIVKRIVDKHQGSITVESRPGDTRFTVTLPRKKAEAR